MNINKVWVLIQRREGSTDHVVVPETYSIDGFFTDEPSAKKHCDDLNRKEGHPIDDPDWDSGLRYDTDKCLWEIHI